VGANLHDHMLATILYESSRTVPPGTSNNLEAHFFAASVPGLPAPDLQPLMSHFPMPVEGYPVPGYGDGYAIVGGVIRPLSRGRLWLRSADPGQAPVLDPHYLEEPADRQALLAAMKLSREIGAGRELEQWRARELAPGPDVRADAELLEYSMANLITYHHQVGTCKMGIDRMAVTGPDLRVHGVDGLRVADASVMPAVTSGNTNAPTIMIGERCADFVLTQPCLCSRFLLPSQQKTRTQHRGFYDAVSVTAPVTPPLSTEIVTVPAWRAVTTPVPGSTEATFGSDELQTWEAGSAIGRVSDGSSSPPTLVPVAVTVSVAPGASVAFGALTLIEDSTGSMVNWRSPSGAACSRPKL
jgi:hypothetical protein